MYVVTVQHHKTVDTRVCSGGNHLHVAIYAAPQQQKIAVIKQGTLYFNNMKCTCITVVLMHATVWNMHLLIHIMYTYALTWPHCD